MRISAGLLIGFACLATGGTVLNAFLINKQFYPSIVYMTKSNASMSVLYLQALTLVYVLFQLLRYIFFGDLRASEAEHLSERAWHAILETCLAFTVFRDDFSSVFVMQFVGLLFTKCFHWLADDRVDMMERSPVITLKFHIRMMSIVAFLGAIDSYLVSHAYLTTLVKGASSQIVFGFEYAILLTMVIHVATKYILHMYDLRTAQAWDSKAVFLLYAELLINMIRCLLYGSFAVVMLRVHTFPLFSVRPFYVSLRALHKAFSDVILSRRAINAMNNQFPTVTAEELLSMDATCIICREEMTADSSPKRLPCSHVFHAHCLRSWFQRQQTCPTCRTEIWGRPANQQPANANAGIAGGQPPQAQQPQLFPFVAHQFAFANQAIPHAAGQNPAPGPFPHQIFYAAPPQNRPEFMLPPPPPPPFFMPPPPFQFPNPPSFDGLSDEELRRIEGQTRSAVEARIRLLNDISTLLDAVSINMQIYLNAAPFARQTTESRESPTPDADLPTTSGTSAQSLFRNNSSSVNQTAVRPETPDSPSVSTSAVTNSPVTRTPESEEMRRRRLARFDRQPDNEEN
ncbi:unnamed protein product [Caenorhabditis auriculariae]|uniref:E3 ubiquitin-protein ligase hrd-1 n=1 Tax=Caenorhabditis auriculariae TaxID=2777116 RepID=A0A8S1GVJ5_9PELO|nr:unnamed protein product [Caenorhabditis auriculariae]